VPGRAHRHHDAVSAAPRPAIAPGSLPARLLVGGLIALVRALPATTRDRLAEAVASLAWALRIRRRVALENLQHAFPERSEAERRRIARGAYRTMARAALDSVTSDLLTDAEVAEAVSVVDWKGLGPRFDAHQAVIVVSAHLGSWELLAEVMARRGVWVSAVVRPLSGAFNAWVVQNRLRAGMELVLQRGAVRGMLAALRRGRAAVQLIDQALPAREALWVPFFGRPASTTPSVSMVALRSGAPVFIALAVREGGALRLHVEGPFPVPPLSDRRAALFAHTAQLTEVIEGYIRRYPEQWLWLHRRWKPGPGATGSTAPTPGAGARPSASRRPRGPAARR
jgi:KDO2-lipid IV(A) lauroyltransferase